MDNEQLTLFEMPSTPVTETGFSDWEVDVGEWEEQPHPHAKISGVTDSKYPISVTIPSVGEYSPTEENLDIDRFSQQNFDDLTILPLHCGEFKEALDRANIITLLAAKEYLSHKLRGNKTRYKKISRKAHVRKWQLEIIGFEGTEGSISNPNPPDRGGSGTSRLLGDLPETLKLPRRGLSNLGNLQVLTSVVPEPLPWDDLGTTPNISEDGEYSGLESSGEELNLSQNLSNFTSSSPTNIVPVGESPSEIPKKKQESVKTDTPVEGISNLSSSQNPVIQEDLISSPKSEIKSSPKSRKLGSFLLMPYQPSRLQNCSYWYLRLAWREGERVKTLHIPGGNADSDLVKERIATLERAVKSGLDKQSILELVKSWRKPRQKRRKSKRSKKR